MNRLEKFSNGLNTYAGRDACIRLVSYFCLFIYGTFGLFIWDDGKDMAQMFLTISVEFARCRIIMRFFDDIPAIYTYWKYVAGNKKKAVKGNSYISILTTINYVSFIVYNPCEHIAWLADSKLIDKDSTYWWSLTNSCWSAALFASVIINMYVVHVYYRQKGHKAKQEDNPKRNSSAIISKTQMQASLLIGLRDAADFLIATNYLPKGFLWSSCIPNYAVGFLGTFSSLCRMPSFVYIK